MTLVFFLEEPSAKTFLEEFLPRFLPASIPFQLISHNGKSDLQMSLPRKLRAWQDREAVFIVLHDQDSHDCKLLKKKLRAICKGARPDITPLVRIACHELEAWYLGDFDALKLAFPMFKPSSVRSRAKYRDVDAIVDAAEDLYGLIPEYQKVSGSRKLGGVLTPDANTSQSFRAFINGLKQLVK